MKQLLFLLLLGGAGLGLAPTAARAQTTDTTRTRPAVKPQLNTAPPGSAPVPAPPRPAPATVPPVYQPAPTAPAPDPNVPASNAPYDPNRPSGMDLPQRPGVAPPPPPLRKYFLYTNLGLGFSGYNGYNQFSASIAPAVGYRFSERFAAGPGLSYAYNSYAFGNGGPSFKTSSLGVKGFAQFIVYKEFFLHGEYEVTKAEVLGYDQFGNVGVYKGTVKTPLAGVGYRNRFSDRAAADIVVLYNFNDGFDDIYGQPVIRFSFLFDLK
ncbi:hypothetical protein CDA63_11030 [Hymenobacter amundsenii]|uniref:Outer membrane protein beta-barrel domain-containing protein n=1 Tax=Hymenobacter amundsenii TaxID=2006685 RepID=A0A246FKG8_9BACT|nr:hypothetical protein [Hymenobacter amundsenii]OWP63060.1 hypothetical protein CDA63_11030 [Hymenobacter amundsenii]